MYAVIQTGGKQYRVAAGDKIRVEKIEGEAGTKVTLNDVLLVASGEDVRIGKPVLEGVQVNAEIVEQGRGEKIFVFKYKRRKNYRKRGGHRQAFTTLRIDGIQA